MSLLDPLRDALRQLRRQPLYAISCAATLALAIGAGVASFAVVKRAFLDPLQYPNSEELVSLLTDTNGNTSAVSAHVLRDLGAANPPFSAFASIRPFAMTYTGPEVTESVTGNAVTSDYFSVLGLRPALGRSWSATERDVVVLGWGLWQRTFAADRAMLGRRITLNGVDYSVVGVMGPDVVTPYWPRPDFWIPLDMQPLLADPARGRRTLSILARRTAPQGEVDAYLKLFSSDLQQKFPVVHGGHSLVARPLRDELVGAASPALLGTGTAAALLLLIVCANIAGLSAARAVGLRQQWALKAALGAGRARLFGERLAESLAISVAGSLGGVWLAWIAVDAIADTQALFLDRLPTVSLDLTTAGAGVAAGLIIGVLAALAPQRLASLAHAAEALGGARGASGDAAVSALRSGLVIAQVALALVLLVGAGLLVRTISHLSSTSLGFRAENVTVFYVNMVGERYASSDRQIQFEREVLEALQRVPLVTSASASVGFPVVGGMGAALSIFGRPDEGGLREIADLSVSPDLMPAIGVPLKAGRGLEESDTETSPPVVVINETMARTFWPNGDAVGARVQIGPGTATTPWMTIVGVLADMRTHGPVQDVRPTAFGSTRQYSWPRRHFSVRTSGPSATLAADLRSAVRAVDPGIAVTAITPVDEIVSNQTARHRLVTVALAFFGIVATMLCGLGLYAVVSLTSRLRRREYAIRLALGARADGVRWMVVKQGLRLAAFGAVAGIGVAAAGTRLLQGLLRGVTPLDGPTFVTAVFAVLALATLATWLPARNAARVDPVETLKAE